LRNDLYSINKLAFPNGFDYRNFDSKPFSGKVSQKNDSDVAHYNFNAHQPILLIFGTDIAEEICY